MRVFGKWRADYNAAFVSAIFSSASLGIDGKIDFLIDTGASKTVILDMDAKSLGIDCRKMSRSKSKMTGIGGSVETYVIEDAELVFSTNESKALAERFEIFALRHPRLNKKVESLPSLLGRDILSKYSLIFSKPSQMAYFTNELIDEGRNLPK